MHTKFRLENLKGRDYLGKLSLDGRIILQWTIQEIDCGEDWIELIQDGNDGELFQV
jgi:hypothetical protein